MPERWKVGDRIEDRYEIYQILKGGMGVVYICYNHENRITFALKTFQNRYLQSQDMIDRFIREAETWVALEKHRNIVKALAVRNIQRMPYIFLEYIANPEMGGADLGRWIRRGLEIPQVLNFAVQICDGMDYAHKKVGMVHRDIKPGNILVTQDKVLKITDFGLVKTVLEEVHGEDFLEPAGGETSSEGVSYTRTGTSMGTAPYMSPEQCRNPRDVDIRSDIYAFGTVLYEMLTGRCVFEAATRKAFVHCHLHEPPPFPGSLVPGLSKDLEVVVLRCLAKDPRERYPTFAVVREELARIYHALAGEEIAPAASGEALEAWEWSNKGLSLLALERLEEAIECCDRALDIDPRLAMAWSNKGTSLANLGRHEEAIECCDRALDINPGLSQVWYNKGTTLIALGRHAEAIECYDRALNIDPGYAEAWNNKGNILADLGRHEEAIKCHDRALDINPGNAKAWFNKGISLSDLEGPEEALECCDRALDIDPRYVQALLFKGNSLAYLGRLVEAIICFDRALVIDPREANGWYFKGNSLGALERYEEALECFNRALDIDPGEAQVWSNKGGALSALGRREEALECCDRALDISPGDADAWLNKGFILANSGRVREALLCFAKVLEIDPHYESAKQAIARCQQYLKQR